MEPIEEFADKWGLTPEQAVEIGMTESPEDGMALFAKYTTKTELLSKYGSMVREALWSREEIPEHDLDRVDIGNRQVVCNCGERFSSLDEIAEHCGISKKMVALLRGLRDRREP